jgi:hypothetical protein
MTEFEATSDDVDLYKTGWEHRNKHIFILSSSGKPIFSRYGDEQDMATTFGLLQAIISVVEDQGDSLRCIKAGSRRIVFFVRHSLYFVCVTSTDEPEVVLSKQLEFMYNQILLILTDQVHRILADNSAKDLRDLLGADTTRIMHAACKTEITPPSIAFHAVKAFMLDPAIRKELVTRLRSCVDKSGAALGLMLHGESLVAYSINQETPLPLDVGDVLLLSHFVGNSSSLRSQDQNWVPICLPGFNSRAILQAYICNMHIAATTENDEPGHIDISLILISASADPQLFLELHAGRQVLETALTDNAETAKRLIGSVGAQTSALQSFLSRCSCYHFFYKVNTRKSLNVAAATARARSLAAGEAVPDIVMDDPTRTPPPQCISSHPEFPMDSEAAMHAIWTHYQRLSVYLRVGTCTAEETLGGVPDPATKIQDGISILNFIPASDHALAYIKQEDGYICVGLATSDTELYATFPDFIGAVDACGFANHLSRSLKIEIGVGNIFQMQI